MCHSVQIDRGATLVFDAAGPEFYDLWVAEALPTYDHGEDAGISLLVLLQLCLLCSPTSYNRVKTCG